MSHDQPSTSSSNPAPAVAAAVADGEWVPATTKHTGRCSQDPNAIRGHTSLPPKQQTWWAARAGPSARQRVLPRNTNVLNRACSSGSLGAKETRGTRAFAFRRGAAIRRVPVQGSGHKAPRKPAQIHQGRETNAMHTRYLAQTGLAARR
jgi:hypothetical protein